MQAVDLTHDPLRRPLPIGPRSQSMILCVDSGAIRMPEPFGDENWAIAC